MNVKQYNHSTQQGNIAFYALVLLPFILTLTILAVDISGWNDLRDHTQRQADTLAFQAAQLLPDQDRALSLVVEKLASSTHSKASNSEISLSDYKFSSHSAQVSLAANYPAAFDAFLEAIGAEQVFRVQETGVVQVVPTDYMIVLSDGATLRPALDQLPWGEPLEWPASGYWSCSADHAMGMTVNSWSEVERQRWSTQSCYNPVLSNIKLAAISLVDMLGASQTNRIGVMFTPGDTTGLGHRVLRHVQGELEVNGNVYFSGQIGGFANTATTGAEGEWRNYQEYETNLGDEACVLFADPNWDLTYPLPGLRETPYLGLRHVSAEDCTQPINLPYCGGNAHGPYGSVDVCYLSQNLRLREAIYWHAAIRSTPQFSAMPKVLESINAALAELVGISDPSESVTRGNMALKTPRKLIFISDWFGGSTSEALDDLLHLLVNTQTQLILVHVNQAYGLNETLRNETTAWLDTVAARAQEAIPENAQQKIVRIFRSSSPEHLRQEVIPKLILLGRQEALRQ